MIAAQSPPAAMLAWIACRRALGTPAEILAAELGIAPDALADPRLPLLEETFARERTLAPAEREARRRDLLVAAADQLLARGRPAEAGRLLRPLDRPAGTRAGTPAAAPEPDTEEATIEAALAEAGAEARAEWDSLGYESWVVPPGSGRRPLASLTAEWVCEADRWRVLEELRRVDDPAERARVLAHFARAGLDPGRDHPAYASGADAPAPAAAPADTLPQASAAAPRPDPSPVTAEPRPGDPEHADRTGAGPAPASEPRLLPSVPAASPPDGLEVPERDPARAAFFARLGEEAEAYHGPPRRRRAAEAWRRHATELGVPLPPHAVLPEALGPDPADHAPAPAADLPAEPVREPWPLCPDWWGRPRDPRTGAPVPDAPTAPPAASARPAPGPSAASWPADAGPRPAEPVPPWPWPAGDGEPPGRAAARDARRPRPAPAGKTTRPRPPEPTPAPGLPRPSAPAEGHRSEHLMADPPKRARGRKPRAGPPPTPPTPPPAPPAPAVPIVWAQEPLGPNRLARLRGDWPWWL